MGKYLYYKYRKMGISRDSRHKRRLTGGRMPIHKKKRQFECGKPAANTRLAAKRIKLVRTNTLTKGTIVYIDATPFSQYVHGHYFAKYDTTKDDKIDWNWETKAENKDFKLDKERIDVQATAKYRRINTTIEHAIQTSLTKGSILARITSRPGQMGRCDGVILEGKELDFYARHIKKK